LYCSNPELYCSNPELYCSTPASYCSTPASYCSTPASYCSNPATYALKIQAVFGAGGLCPRTSPALFSALAEVSRLA
jgi:hypothetical protein